MLIAVLLSQANFATQALAQQPVPRLQNRVTDLTATLDSTQISYIEQKLKTFELTKGSQIAVLMVKSVSPESIEQYSLRVAQTWKLGRRGINDGILLLIALNDRALRIEVGYGLEGAVSDSMARRVIDEIITPRFKQGDYYSGIYAGVDAIIKLVSGEKLPAPDRRARSGADWSGVKPFLSIILIIFVVVAELLAAVLGRALTAVLSGLLAGVLTGIFCGPVLGVIAGLVAMFFMLMPPDGWFGSRRYRDDYRYGSRYGGGSYRSSSGGSFGGFSGGGGSFGGGGASGRW